MKKKNRKQVQDGDKITGKQARLFSDRIHNIYDKPHTFNQYRMSKHVFLTSKAQLKLKFRVRRKHRRTYFFIPCHR